MSFPNTAAGLLVLVLAVLPGLPGDYVYRTFVGVSWRERDFKHGVRLLTLSVLGLILYSMLAGLFHWTLPAHVIPATFTSADFSAARLPQLGLSYLGHFAGSAVAGALAAFGLKALAKVSPATTARDSWDHFVHSTVQNRWVLVSLISGDTYVGMVAHADVATAPEFRDLILVEPYRFDDEDEAYKPTYQQHLFVRGPDVASVATVYHPDTDADTRVVPVNESPFAGNHNE